MMLALSVQCVGQSASMTFRRPKRPGVIEDRCKQSKKVRNLLPNVFAYRLNGTLCIQQEYSRNVRYAIRNKLKKVNFCKYMNKLINIEFNC